jgi:predicted DNA-binding antitoxin AbrB/MazE fold protein
MSLSYNYGMTQRVDAIYEDGLLRPLRPLDLPDGERVSVTVESAVGDKWLDHDVMEWARQEGDPTISLDDVRHRLAGIHGSLSDLVIAERRES